MQEKMRLIACPAVTPRPIVCLHDRRRDRTGNEAGCADDDGALRKNGPENRALS